MACLPPGLNGEWSILEELQRRRSVTVAAGKAHHTEVLNSECERVTAGACCKSLVPAAGCYRLRGCVASLMCPYVSVSPAMTS